MTKDEVFQKAVQKSKIFTIVMRLLSFACMLLGIYLVFSPITTLLGYIPLVGGLLKGVLTFVILLGAVIVCIPLWILMTSVSWMVWHPKVGFILLAIGGVVLALLIFLGRGGTIQDEGQAHMQAVHHAFLTLRQAL